MHYISRQFLIERLLPAISLERLIGQYVQLKKSGSSYVCCCPFHHEKTPSFHVTPAKQMFYCFGCQEHGDAIDFIEKYKHLEFAEAVEELARYAGMEVEYEDAGAERHDNFEPFYTLLERCAAYYADSLRRPSGQEALAYLREKRALSEQLIHDARLGYAPDDLAGFEKAVCREGEDHARLVQLGLINEAHGRSFAFFRNRVMIPIMDRRGRVISFGGRTLQSDDQRKYMNTAESPVYRKRYELFGLYEALQANRNRPERLVVVEGYMDVLSLRQAGLSEAVASLGTATTKDQLQMMFRYTKKVIFCYDGDNAGRRAAWRALETVTPLLSSGLEVRFAFLEAQTKVDPDSLVREQGLEAFEAYLSKAASYPEFLISHTAKSYNLSDIMQRAAFVDESLKLAKRIPVGGLQAMTINLLAAPSGTENAQLYRMMEALPDEGGAAGVTWGGIADEPGERSPLSTPMRRLIAFVLQQPQVIGRIYDEFALDTFVALCRTLEVRGFQELQWLLAQIRDQGVTRPALFRELTRGTSRERYCNVLLQVPLRQESEAGSARGEWSWGERVRWLAKQMAGVLSTPLEQRNKLLARMLPEQKAGEVAELTRQIRRINDTGIKAV